MSNFGNSERYSSFESLNSTDNPRPNGTLPLGNEVFLLDPANRDFLDKQIEYPAFMSGMLNSSPSFASGYGCSILIFLPLVALVLFFLWSFLGPAIVPRALNTYGVATTATITKTSKDYDYDGNLSGYSITYSYQPSGSQNTVSSESIVPQPLWETLKPGQLIPIHYLKFDPYLTHFDTLSTPNLELSSSNIVIWVVLTIVVGIFFFILRSASRTFANSRWMLQKAFPQMQVVRGEVIKCTGRLDSDDGFIIDLTYCYGSPTTVTDNATGEVKRVRNDLNNGVLPTPGTPLAVCVFPQRLHVPGYGMGDRQHYEFVL